VKITSFLSLVLASYWLL